MPTTHARREGSMGRTNGYKHAFHPTPNQLTPHTHTNNPHRRLQLRRVGALRGAVPDHAGGHGLLRLPLRQRLRGPPHVQARVRVCVCVCVCLPCFCVCVCAPPFGNASECASRGKRTYAKLLFVCPGCPPSSRSRLKQHTQRLPSHHPPPPTSPTTTATAASSAWSARPVGSRWTGSASTRPPPPSPLSSAWP
jgi:hypothetical protein